MSNTIGWDKGAIGILWFYYIFKRLTGFILSLFFVFDWVQLYGVLCSAEIQRFPNLCLVKILVFNIRLKLDYICGLFVYSEIKRFMTIKI